MQRASVSVRRASARAILIAAGAMSLPAPALADNPFASTVESYTTGTGFVQFSDSTAALGSPTRYSGVIGGFPGSVTPFNPSWDPGETVSLGLGGSLTVSFDHPVTNDPNNPYGIDLLVFGNSFFTNDDFSDIATKLSREGGVISVSQDGIHWHTVNNVEGDGLWPTLGYADETNPFGGPAGNVPTDFTRPVDPSLAWLDRPAMEIIAGYNGSGGGAGIDIGALGLEWIQYVRVTNDVNGMSPEIDGFSDVSPTPAPATALPLGIVLASRRRRR